MITRAQLVECGLSRRAIAHRVAHGRLHPLHRGVFLLGHAVPPPLALETAALLACGPGAILSHGTAAHLWGLMARSAGPPHITLSERNSGARPNVHTHRSPVPSDQRTRRHGLPLTTPARTLVDLADTLPLAELERTAAEAEVRQLVRPVHLLSLLERGQGRRGATKLEQLLHQGPQLTRSEAERRLLSLTRAARLPAPQLNARLGRFTVDALWREQRLVVEVDGFAFHGSRAAFERDRRRDAELGAAGYRIVRLTWARLTMKARRSSPTWRGR